MATKFSEVLPVRLPEGARQALADIAQRRYQSVGPLARQAIMREIDLLQATKPQISGVAPRKHAA